MGQTIDLADVRRLPLRLDAVVTEDFIDINGHMNITQYLRLGAEAVELVLQEAGMDQQYREGRQMSCFAVEHHLTYRAEMHLGEKIAVHPQLLGSSERAAHVMVYLVDETNDRLANTLEAVLVHVGMDDRRSRPFPDDVAPRLTRLAAEMSPVLEPPLSGAMGLRR
ncbi:thioesterase family protein [Nocardioides campestrisoli]|uniref:thioesterase family protein n=1 Tax=Nocardioides campestrisoli TaxID=2736757 RepID=UPI00163D3FFF|nr:thioesterase family protein [Nocardioides campestrisoli]